MTPPWTNVLVVAPHPDDEILGCGGTMMRIVAAGGRVSVCIVTRGHHSLFADEVIEQGRTEAKTAHARIGVHETTFLDFPAPMLDTVPKHRIADSLRDLISIHRFDTVFVPHHGDIHHDHAAVYEGALVACRPLSGNPVRRVYAYETLSETEWAPPRADAVFVPTMFVDITDVLDAKVETMACYATQVKAAPHPRSGDGLVALARLRGFTVGCPAAEAFAVIREIHDR